MTDTDKLKIALTALLELRAHETVSDQAATWMRRIAVDALRQIQRDRYLGESSQAVHEVLTGVRNL